MPKQVKSAVRRVLPGAAAMRYPAAMTRPAPLTETDTHDGAERRRLAWEAERIAEADADIDAGRLVDSAMVKAWIDSIGTNHELPVPCSGR